MEVHDIFKGTDYKCMFFKKFLKFTKEILKKFIFTQQNLKK